MASQAREDQKRRTIEVNREKLLETLKTNLIKHVKKYEEALEGYKEMALKKLQEGYEKAKIKLDKNLKEAAAQLDEFDPEDTGTDYITLIDPVTVQLKVPRSCADEYEAAIDMAKWDVRETLELTHAEFQCFVRDEWTWSNDFARVSLMYSKKG